MRYAIGFAAGAALTALLFMVGGAANETDETLAEFRAEDAARLEEAEEAVRRLSAALYDARARATAAEALAATYRDGMDTITSDAQRRFDATMEALRK